MALINAGVETALTARYVDQILTLSGAATLAQALEEVRSKAKEVLYDGKA